MSGYIGTQPVPQATQHRETFTATASQTTFATVGYTPQFVDVYLNGIHLLDTVDYTATNSSDVVLTTGAAASDVVEIISYSPFEVADQTFTGTTTVDVLTATGAMTGTDLTLSGGVYLGGTGAANYLQDYETGTFTPSFEFDIGGTGITYGVRNGRYIKVGNMVTIMFTIQINGGVTSSDYFLRLVTPFAGYNVGTDFAKVSVYNTYRPDFRIATQGGSGSMLCYATSTHNDFARGDDIPAGTYVSGVITYSTP